VHCTNCGQSLPVEARFCFLCGAPLARSEAGFGPVAASSEDAEPSCQIQLWRGYRKSEFVVELDAPDASGIREHRSPPFRWTRPEPPPRERDDVRAAYADLVARLRALGWEQSGVAHPWYAQSFRPRPQGLHVVETAEDVARDVSREIS
jgi:hypothetical protein